VRQELLEPSSSKSSSSSALAQVFSQLYQQSYASKYSEDFKKGYEERFLAALLMYRHPIVYDIMERQCVIADNLLDGGDADLMDHEPYAALCRDPDRIQEIVGVLPSSDSMTVVVEGRDRLATSEASQNDKDSQEEPPAANPAATQYTQAHNENEDDDADMSEDESAANPATQDQQAQNESADEDDMSQEDAVTNLTTQKGQPQNEDNVDMSQEDPVANLATQEEDAQNSHHSSQQEDDVEAPLTQEPDRQHRVNGHKRRSRWKKGKKKKNGGLVVLGEDSDDIVSFMSDGTTQSQEGSVNDTTTSMEARSPNLLYFSTPEKTIASQKSAQTSSTSKSPNLLYSSTPEKTTQASQSQEDPSPSSV
jgi:hypothetical protein